jgi:23S rRNA (cytosine1962-C5)-methyltransferase
MNELMQQIQKAVELRLGLKPLEPEGALRLFNGFIESEIDLVIDRYAKTLVFFNHADPPESLAGALEDIQKYLLSVLPDIECILVKTRRLPNPDDQRGLVTFGKNPAGCIKENGIHYALDLRLNQDASFYLDTRNLRSWLKDHGAGWQVLNCFAYTGSLGAAAIAGGASRVAQLDLSGRFLSVAKRTYQLNGYPIAEKDFLAGDFFRLTSHLRRAGEKFDCVILDAPFFSSGTGAAIHTQQDTSRLINKVRPLVKNGGFLVAINNALFLSGQEYLAAIEELGQDGCLEISEILSVPEDVTGFPQTHIRRPPSDPTPFNHPTKIAILRVKNKNRMSRFRFS